MSTGSNDDRSYRPRWLRYAWFLGRPPELTRRQWRVLGLVSIVSFFEMYDLYLFSLNLKQIQADLGLAESQLGLLGAIVRGGAIPAILVTLAADRLGRRRMLLFTVVAYTLCTGATALSTDGTSFVVLQFLARTFGAAELLIAVVVIAEEFDPQHRGWGIGALFAIQACGAGAAAILFGFVDILPWGWRSLYLVGLGPLVLVTYWRRTLPETDRFIELARARVTEPSGARALQPAFDLMRAYPGRFWALAVAVFALGVAANPAGFFTPKYLQDVHGWGPPAVAFVTFAGGAFAIVANPFAGWLSDRRGRKPVTILFALAYVAVALTFFNALGPVVGLLWIFMVFMSMGSDVTLATYGAELFPTSYRSTATGARSSVATLGAVVGLAGVTALFEVMGSNWAAISLLLCLGLLVPVIVALFFPETAGRTLEEIAPERAPHVRSSAVSGGAQHVPR
jgi:putative MFS transporter